MRDEHSVNTEMKTGKKDKQMINQIDGWNIETKFNENGLSLENLVEEYIRKKFSVYWGLTKNIRSVIISLWKLNLDLVHYM